jgi:hypothetical protein
VADCRVFGWMFPLLQITTDQIVERNHYHVFLQHLATYHSVVETLLTPVNVIHVHHTLSSENHDQTVSKIIGSATYAQGLVLTDADYCAHQ